MDALPVVPAFVVIMTILATQALIVTAFPSVVEVRSQSILVRSFLSRLEIKAEAINSFALRIDDLGRIRLFIFFQYRQKQLGYVTGVPPAVDLWRLDQSIRKLTGEERDSTV